MSGLSHGSRLISIVLAVGVHAAAAAAFMLTPKTEPPPPPQSVEIEMLAEITSVVAEEVEPTVAAASEAVEQASESQPGETAAQPGEMVEQVAALDKPTEMVPDEVEEIEKPEDQPEAETAPEAETPTEAETPAVETPPDTEETPAAETPPEQAPVATPVELEKPVIEAPTAPALVKKPKPVAKTVKKTRKVKTAKQRLAVAGSTVSKDNRREVTSQARVSGGARSSANYASIVKRRLLSRSAAMIARIREKRQRLVVVSFSIGASGSVRSASISRSSGDAALDSQIRAIVASIDFPPPPPGAKASWVVPIALKGQ